MSELIAVGFKQDVHRASAVLNRLSAMSDDWAVDIDDALAIYRDESGNLKVDEAYEMTIRQEARLGAFWGAVVGALIGIPLTAGASGAMLAGALAATTLGGAALGATSGAHDGKFWKDGPGSPEAFVRDAAAMLQPGDSAILALLPAFDPHMAEEFRGYGGTVLQATLNKEQSTELQAILDSRDTGFVRGS